MLFLETNLQLKGIGRLVISEAGANNATSRATYETRASTKAGLAESSRSVPGACSILKAQSMEATTLNPFRSFKNLPGQILIGHVSTD